MTKIMTVAAVVALLATYVIAEWRSKNYVAEAGFWFENVTYELPHLRAAGLGPPLAEEEKGTIESIARAELRSAFAGLRIVFSNDHEAYYKVRVVQQFGPGRGGPGAAGATRVVRPLGGNGSVNFLLLGSQAVLLRPKDADRAAVVEAIGRGIGRSAVHEFTHQILPGIQIHDSKDRDSYEFAFSSRPAQYYGQMRWDIAWPALVDKLGPVDRTRVAAPTSNPE